MVHPFTTQESLLASVSSLAQSGGCLIPPAGWLQNHLLSASLDSSISIWAVAETPAPGAVLEREPTYRHITQDHQVGNTSLAQQPVIAILHMAKAGKLKLCISLTAVSHQVLCASIL